MSTERPLTPQPRKRPSRLARAATLLAVAVLGVHFSIIWLYLTPNNPLKLTLWNDVHAYVHPFFAQNWQLFAPNPISHDETLHVKARWREEGSDRVWETDWIDVTTPIHRKIHEKRIGPYSKLARPYTGVREALEFTEPVAVAIRERAKEAFREGWQESVMQNPPQDSAARRLAYRTLVMGLDSLNVPTEVERAQQRAGREMAYRLASANAKQAVGGRGELVAINVRFVTHEFPRFSRRNDPDAKGSTLRGRPLGWEAPRLAVTLP